MYSNQQRQTQAENNCRDQEVAIREGGLCLAHQSDLIRFDAVFESFSLCYFSELISMTKRYFTSCFNMRSKAALIFCMGITSTSAVMFFWPQ